MITVCLAGNPNCGKTTIFNKITKTSHKMEEWSEENIDLKKGITKRNSDIEVVDLPSTYSLSAYSPEEVITRDFLLDHDPDAIIDVIDASSLERNLYLTLQLLDLQFPTVIALNMIDVAEKRGMTVDVQLLSKCLGCPVIPVHAKMGKGLDELIDAVSEQKEKAKSVVLSKDIEDALVRIERHFGDDVPDHERRWHSTKIFAGDVGTIEDHPQLWDDVKDIISELEEKYDDRSDGIMAKGRYDVIERITKQCVKKKERKDDLTEKIDSVVLNKWLGIPIFVLILFGIYFISVASVGKYCTDWIHDILVIDLNGWVRDWLGSIGADGALISLVCDGIINGVGTVLSFLPQILILFLFITILEECGYMSRVCFLFDRIFRKFNLSGKSLIPLMIGSGCSVPGIMSAKMIDNESDRKLTAITTSFIPCSSKLPIIAMIAGAVLGGSAIAAVFAYLTGILCVLISGIILKKMNRYKGDPTMFVMELPPYHVPSLFITMYTPLSNGWEFVRKAGTVILIACSVVWALSSFNWSFQYLNGDVSHSMLADIGKAISFVFVPLGWGENWEFTVATLTALMSKETFVGTLGVLLGDQAISVMGSLLTVPAGLSLLIFNMICMPCVAAVVTMKRELGSWKETVFAVAYQCILAYAVALIVYQFGTWFVTGTFGIGTAFAIVVTALMILLLAVNDPFRFFEKRTAKC